MWSPKGLGKIFWSRETLVGVMPLGFSIGQIRLYTVSEYFKCSLYIFLETFKGIHIYSDIVHSKVYSDNLHYYVNLLGESGDYSQRRMDYCSNFFLSWFHYNSVSD